MKNFLLYFPLLITLVGFSPQTAKSQPAAKENAQTSGAIDSLEQLLASNHSDTDRINILIKLCDKFIEVNAGRSIEYGNKAVEAAKKLRWKAGLASAYNSTGLAYSSQGNYKQAEQYDKKALDLRRDLGNHEDIVLSLNRMGLNNIHQGNYGKALEYLFEALTIIEKQGNNKNLTSILANIGTVYANQEIYGKALEYFKKALLLLEQKENKSATATCLNNIAAIYYHQSDTSRALEFFQKSLKLREEIGNLSDIAGSLSNLGGMLADMGNYNKAKEYLERALKINTELGYKADIAVNLHNLAHINTTLKRHDKAGQYYLQSLELSKETGYIDLIKETYKNMAENYAESGNHKSAYQYQRLYIELKDSLTKQQNSKQIAGIEANYENEKKKVEIKLLQKDKEIQEAELAKKESEVKRQGIQRNALVTGFLMLIVLVLVIYRGYRQKKKYIGIIEQNSKDITDSIRYAKKIQDAILPKEEEIIKTFPDNFVYYMPKAIVSGDFYWFSPPRTPVGGSSIYRTQVGDAYKTTDPLLYGLMKEKADEMRNNPTPAEAVLWKFLCNSQTGYKIRRQHVIDRFIADFACTGKKVIIEIDGDIHDMQKEEDSFRTVVLEGLGFVVVRFRNEEVIAQPEKVIQKIKEVLDNRKLIPHSAVTKGGTERLVLPPPGGRGGLIAVCDCTGHGVPGAFVSFIGNDLLNQIINEKGVEEPGKILTLLNKGMKSVFTREGAEQQAQDGMDVVFCCLTAANGNVSGIARKQILEFAGANNPLILIQDGKLKQIRGDKTPIGGETAENYNFTNHRMEVQNGDTVYLFSDGYQDQFGGTKNKKFMIKRLMELLFSVHTKPMREQKEILSQTIDQWKGEHEQVDDICIIGIRI